MLSAGLLLLPPVSRNDWKLCSSSCPSSSILLVVPAVPTRTLKDPEIQMQTLWLSKGDHSALTPAQLLPSLPALPFLPISSPVLINLYLINLIPIDVWHQGIELKVYKINECEEKHEAVVQERKCSQGE